MSGNKLKITALITMIIDHMYKLCPSVPLWFRWIGRISAPLFIFCVVWSFTYTRNKKRYMLRLYTASVIMSFINWGFSLGNNIFRLMFSITVVLYLIELYKSKDKNAKRYTIFYFVWQTISCAVIILSQVFISFDLTIIRNIGYFVLPAVTGSIIYLEYGYIFVILGVIIYLCKDSKKDLITYYTYFCLFYLWITTSTFLVYLYKIPFNFSYLIEKIIGLNTRFIGQSMFSVSYQWMMVFALPFMLAYNHEKGKDWRYLYYIVYPVHLILFNILGRMLLNV